MPKQMSDKGLQESCDNAPVVHIGLGKTGTTSLQRNVFPAVKSLRPEISYNDPGLMQQLRRLGVRNSTDKEERTVFNAVHQRQTFISLESLADWNPRNWERAADRNLRIFGSTATIIITVRDTESYLRSVYQQMVHQGNIRSPHKFFVSAAEYDAIAPCLAPAILSRLDVDSFDLEALQNIYTQRFDNVSMVPSSKLNELEFLREIFALSDSEIQFLKEKLNNSRPHNRAYSKGAMALTMKRERILNACGVMTIGTDYSTIKRAVSGSRVTRRALPFYCLTRREKLHQIPFRIVRRFLRGVSRRARWRFLMQNVYDKVVPYKRYTLPSDVYRNEELQERNDAFIQRLEG